MNKIFQQDSESNWKRLLAHYQKAPLEEIPLISVIIPTFNQAHILENTLNSLFVQENAHFEIVIVDAGSTDGTYELLQKFQPNIARIYFATKYELALMINKGVTLAKGEYVSFMLPGYEYLNPYSLCHIARTAYENNHPDFVYAADNHIEEALKEYMKLFKNSYQQLDPSFTLYPFSKEYLVRGFLPTSPTCMWFKKRTFDQLGELNPSYNFTKSIFDLLCRIYKTPKLRSTSTYWVVSDTAHLDTDFLSAKVMFDRWVLIYKYFGLVSFLLWFFREKPVHLVAWLIKSLHRTFKKEE